MESLMERIEKICNRIWELIEQIMNSEPERLLKFIPLLFILIIGLIILPKIQWLVELGLYAWVAMEVTTTRKLLEKDLALKNQTDPKSPRGW